MDNITWPLAFFAWFLVMVMLVMSVGAVVERRAK